MPTSIFIRCGGADEDQNFEFQVSFRPITSLSPLSIFSSPFQLARPNLLSGPDLALPMPYLSPEPGSLLALSFTRALHGIYRP